MTIIKNNIPLLERPYRSCVGLMVFNREGKVFCGQRLDNKAEAWQLPQGGIDKGELPVEAGYRELKEETSITNVDFVSEYPEWLNYDIPEVLANKLWHRKYRGQTQKWVALRFQGSDADINIGTPIPEFSNWCWVIPEKLPNLAAPFKRKVYEHVLTEFKPYLKQN